MSRKRIRELAVFRMGKDSFCEAVSKEKPGARILGCEQGESLASGGEVADTFKAQVAPIGVFQQDVIAKLRRGGILGKHDNYSPAK